jgi:glycosyltransferase involved in cell wall biosynthesis
MENLILILLCLPGLLYACWIVILFMGLNREFHRETHENVQTSGLFVSIIVAVRNESEHILSLLNDLLLQDAGYDRFEIILVDDHSVDQTAEMAKAFSEEHPELCLKIITLEGETESSKKAALRVAMGVAKGFFILRTDADCRLPSTWISSYCREFAQGDFLLIAGLVVIQKGKSIFSRLQALEFMSLSAAGIAMAGLGKPVYANAANLGHMREVNDENTHDRLQQLASGDDVSLLLSVAKGQPGRIRYLMTEQNTVVTQASRGLKDFVQQRIRWAGKARHNYSAMNSLTAIWVFLYSLMMMIWPALSAIDGHFLIAAGWIIVVKMVTDFILLRSFSSMTGQDFLIRDFILLSFIYPIYVLTIALCSLRGRYEWKDRLYVGQ